MHKEDTTAYNSWTTAKRTLIVLGMAEKIKKSKTVLDDINSKLDVKERKTKRQTRKQEVEQEVKKEKGEDDAEKELLYCTYELHK